MTTKRKCQTVAAETAKSDAATPQVAVTPQPPSPFTDFTGLVNYLPMYKPRTLRALVKKKILPHIRPPGTRKLGFFLPAVESAMRRFEKGGIQQ